MREMFSRFYWSLQDHQFESLVATLRLSQCPPTREFEITVSGESGRRCETECTEIGDERRCGVTFRAKSVPAVGSKNVNPSNGVDELDKSGKYNGELTKDTVKAGEVDLTWPHGGFNAGWIDFLPDQQIVCFISQEEGKKLIEPEMSVDQFA